MTGQAPRIDSIETSLDSGTYIPVASNFVNVQGSSGNRTHHWIKIKNQVFVHGYYQIDPSSSLDTPTSFQINLPIASNFTNSDDCVGNCSNDEADSTRIQIGTVIADTSTNQAKISYRARDGNGRDIFYSFAYTIK